MAKLGREFLTQAVRDHADKYADAGWDVVRETMSDQDIINILGRTRTVTGAVTTVAEYAVRPWVSKLVETRPGKEDDEALGILERFNAERRANSQDATLWWPEDKRQALLERMAAPEGGILQVPGQRTEIPPLVVQEPEKTAPAPVKRGQPAKKTVAPRNRTAARSTANRR